MLAEAARQFVRLVDVRRAISGDAGPAKKVAESYLEFVKRTEEYTGLRKQLGESYSDKGSQEERLTTLRDDLGKLTFACSAALRRPDGELPPALIFIDTFEEVQFAARQQLDPFWNLVSALTRQSVGIKVLISGRPPLAEVPDGIRTQKMQLAELEEAMAIDLLQRETGLPCDVVRPVARQIGGNPLNLRLAARILVDEIPKGGMGIGNLEVRRLGLFRVSGEVIRGRLYRRLLERIHDEGVRQLAHPGMVLRRVTAPIIQQVLAPACNMPDVDAKRAKQLFEALRAEHTLVRIDDDTSLRYRDDVRGPVLAMMASEAPEQSRRVHQLALRFYASADDPVSVAEYIYHGLMTGLDKQSLDAAWNPEAARHLATAVTDLPPAGQVWLATKMSISLDPSLRTKADTAAWEAIVGPDALSLLEGSGSAQALEKLGERSERTDDSPLFAIEARCLMSLKRPENARILLEAALEHYPVIGNNGRRAELCWLLSQVCEQMGEATAGTEALDHLIAIARDLPGKVALVQALTARIARVRKSGGKPAEFQDALVAALQTITKAEAQSEPDVVWSGVAAVTRDQSAKVLRVIGGLQSSIYDFVKNRRISVSVSGIADLAAQIIAAADVPELKPLADIAAWFGTGKTDQTSDLRAVVEVAFRAIEGDSDPGGSAAKATAARLIWTILQMASGTLEAASLAGIDEFRPDWQRNAGRHVSV